MDPLKIEEYDKRIIENMTTGSLEKNFRASLEKGTIWDPLFKKRKGGDETKSIKYIESRMQSS